MTHTTHTKAENFKEKHTYSMYVNGYEYKNLSESPKKYGARRESVTNMTFCWVFPDGSRLFVTDSNIFTN